MEEIWHPSMATGAQPTKSVGPVEKQGISPETVGQAPNPMPCSLPGTTKEEEKEKLERAKVEKASKAMAKDMAKEATSREAKEADTKEKAKASMEWTPAGEVIPGTGADTTNGRTKLHALVDSRCARWSARTNSKHYSPKAASRKKKNCYLILRSTRPTTVEDLW